MPEIVREAAAELEIGKEFYIAHVWGEQREDGRWEGWIEFRPDGDAPTLATATETVQSSRDALAYWASGLEPVYFEGAWDRARRAEAAMDAAQREAELWRWAGR